MKRLNNKKAFTLVEVLVAMGLLTLVVFVFSPLMLASLKSVQMSSEVRQEVAAGKTNVEMQLADGVDPTASNIATIEFSQSGAPTTGAAAGDYVANQVNDRTLVGFSTNAMPTMTVSPSEILETNAGVGTKFLVYCDKLEFNDITKFKLVSKDYSATNSGVPKDVGVKFDYISLDDGTTDKHRVSMTITSGRLKYYESTYKILYDGMDAQIKVHIVPLIAAGANGTMLFKINGAWPTDAKAGELRKLYIGSSIGSQTIQDMVWNGQQYAVGGTNGLWAYNTANNGWASKSLWGGRTSVTDIATTQDGTFYAAGVAESWGISYMMRQQLSDAASIKTTSDSNIYRSLMHGTTVETGYLSKTGAEQAVWGYDFWSYPYLSDEIDSYYLDTSIVPDRYVGVTMTSNHKQGEDSSFLASFAYGRDQNSMVLYQWNCGENRSPDITNGNQWKDITYKANGGGVGNVVRIHYYQLANYADGDTIIKIEGGLGLEEKQDANKRYYVTYPTEADKIYLENGDLYQYEDVQTYTDGASYTMTGVYNGMYALDDVWSVGGEITLARNTGELVTVTGNKKQNLSKWAGNKFLSVSNDVKYFVDRTQITLSSVQTPLVYQSAEGEFYPAVLRAQTGKEMVPSQYENYRINAIEYIGGRLYAVGNGGLILSSLDGKDWTVEREYKASNNNLYSIAGTGEYLETAGG